MREWEGRRRWMEQGLKKEEKKNERGAVDKHKKKKKKRLRARRQQTQRRKYATKDKKKKIHTPSPQHTHTLAPRIHHGRTQQIRGHQVVWIQRRQLPNRFVSASGTKECLKSTPHAITRRKRAYFTLPSTTTALL